jgi:predicted NodU family carbamoyl transferase
MIHKQQLGHPLPDIIAGLCQAMVRNYLNNVGKNKDIRGPIFFQGGVAANLGIRKAFEEELGQAVIVPEHYDVMGALGAAYLAQEKVGRRQETRTRFRGLHLGETQFQAKSFECSGCANRCEVVDILQEGISLAKWGDRCGKWSTAVGVSSDQGRIESSEEKRRA